MTRLVIRDHFEIGRREDDAVARRHGLLALVLVSTVGIGAGLSLLVRDDLPAALLANLHDLTMGIL